MSGGPLRVSIDVSAVPARPAGAGRYVVELVRALGRRQEVSLTLVARGGDGRRWEELAPKARIAPEAPVRRPPRLIWEQLLLPRLLHRLHVDVHHGPHYTMPERARLPVVVTVHDCTFFDHPEWHERSKVILFRRAIRVAASRAAGIVCVSRATAGRLAALCPGPAPVSVVAHGVDLERFTPDEPSPGADEARLAVAGVRAPYVAFVGTVEPRKDVPTLVAAFARLARDRPSLGLVLAGGPGWGSAAAEVDRAIASAGLGARILRTGYLPDDALPALLRRAAAVAYPSRAEGFGLPALEALACGAPVVTTAGSAMAEVAGGVAVLVAPGDAAALAAGLDRVLAARPDPGPGVAVARTYTWAACAEGHIGAYRRAAGKLAP